LHYKLYVIPENPFEIAGGVSLFISLASSSMGYKAILVPSFIASYVVFLPAPCSRIHMNGLHNEL